MKKDLIKKAVQDEVRKVLQSSPLYEGMKEEEKKTLEQTLSENIAKMVMFDIKYL